MVSPRRDRNGVTAMNELAVVRAAIYLCRSLHKHPSRRLIDNLIRTVHGRSIRGTHIDALIAQVVSESENGTVPNTTGRPYASYGTQRDTTGRTRENKNKIIETVPTLLSVATERDAEAIPVQILATKKRSAKEKTELALPGMSDAGKQAKVSTRKPQPGHFILDAVARLVEPCLVAQTITLWRKCNATIAHDMAAAGITPEIAARDWQRAHAAGDTCITLKSLRYWMQEAKNSSAEEPKYIRPTEAMLYAVAN